MRGNGSVHIPSLLDMYEIQHLGEMLNSIIYSLRLTGNIHLSELKDSRVNIYYGLF